MIGPNVPHCLKSWSGDDGVLVPSCSLRFKLCFHLLFKFLDVALGRLESLAVLLQINNLSRFTPVQNTTAVVTVSTIIFVAALRSYTFEENIRCLVQAARILGLKFNNGKMENLFCSVKVFCVTARFKVFAGFAKP